MQAFALVDYDNVKPIQKERADADVQANIMRIAQHAAIVARANYPEAKNLEIRLYGGWTDKKCASTAACTWMERVLHTIRTRINGVRVTPWIAVSNYEETDSRLVGLYRDGGQKMVDTLIVADLITLTSRFRCPVLVLSEDDDMIPGLVASRYAKRDVTLIRNRRIGDGMNDHVISSLGVQIAGGIQ